MRPIAALSLIACLWAAHPAGAQVRARIVQTDQSVTAADSLSRVQDFIQAGNHTEALRVLQQTLEAEGDRLLATRADPDLFVPVRTVVHDLLLADRSLLTRYRSEQSARAEELLRAGRIDEVERSRLLTPAGFEAALRLAQIRMESAQFESARLALAQLERHPDRTDKGAQDAARMALQLASYLPRAQVRDWAQRWAREASLADRPGEPAVTPRIEPAVTPLDPLPVEQFAPPGESPLQSVSIEGLRGADEDASRRPAQPWVFPTLVGERVLVNDGDTISAYDAATLSEVWKARPSRATAAQVDRDSITFTYGVTAGQTEDVSNVAIGRGVLAVGAGGFPENAQRRGDPRIHAVDLRTGRIRWSVDIREHDSLDSVTVRGPVVIEDDTVVLSLRRTGLARRDTSLFLAGLDLYDGRVKWLRLAGTIGTNPWGRVQGRPDGAIITEGVVYRADEMGLVAAYEAATGRPVWLRLTSSSSAFNPGQFQRVQPAPPFELHLPVAWRDSLFVVEPSPDGGRVLRLRAVDGAVLGSRPATRLGDPRYLVAAGEVLACVSPSRVAFVPMDGFENAEVRLSAPFSSPAPAGRAVVSGGRVLLPLEQQIAVIDPSDPSRDDRIPTPASGNLLPVGTAQGHLLVADASHLHTFVPWERAEAILDARIAARPDDAEPVLNMIELSQRAARADRVVELADRALALLDRRADQPDAARARERLFFMLLATVREGHAAWETRDATQAPEPFTPSPIRDLPLLDALAERVARAAESSEQQVWQLFERAWLRDVQDRHSDAVEFYQQVLMEPALAEVPLASAGDGLSLPGAVRPAGEEAAHRLSALLRRVGAEAYRAFDDQAQSELASLADRAPPEEYQALSRRFPAAQCAPAALLLASQAYARAGRPDLARLAAGDGLTAAELAAAMGRPSPQEAISRLAGTLIEGAKGPLDAEPVYRLLRRLAREHTGLAIEFGGTNMSPDAAAEELRAALAARSGLPRLGVKASPEAQVIEGWEPVEAREKFAPYLSGDALLMHSEVLGRVALWAPAPDSGRLKIVWSRPTQARPTLIRITPDDTVLFWNGPAGGWLESVSTADGSARWKTPEYLSIFGVRSAEPVEPISTPLDGRVRSDDLVLAADRAAIAIVQRSGRIAVFDSGDGRVLWSSPGQISRVYETAVAGSCLLVAGSIVEKSEGFERMSAAVICYDLRSGRIVTQIGKDALGDHVRWIRGLPDGDAVIATSDGISRLDPRTGQSRWNRSGPLGKLSLPGWVVGSGLFLLENDLDLKVWHVSLATGHTEPAPVDARGKIDLPLSAQVVGNTICFSSPRGTVSFDESGRLLGADSIEAPNSIEPPAVAERVVVAVESSRREFVSATPDTSLARLYFLESPGGRLLNIDRIRLFDSPRSISLIDGKILISQGQVTIVVDARPAGP